MSTPAQKPRPSAARITARVAGSAPAPVTASASSNQACAGSALTGGKSMITSAMPSWLRSSMPIATSLTIPSACLGANLT